ncbi:hypothetical protein QR680_005043 [Steinernema hermaphroditum]|uniref:Transmembrane protein n=1 Tax=Steinernema hermaphroditum TaxID=289476 RepID=A0AA39LV01_9BILA|nr:hypothetical protein QR680_005043 [Steinernema hermaphroditum]
MFATSSQRSFAASTEAIMLEQMSISENGATEAVAPPPYKMDAKNVSDARRLKPISERMFAFTALLIFGVLAFVALLAIAIAMFLYI